MYKFISVRSGICYCSDDGIISMKCFPEQFKDTAFVVEKRLSYVRLLKKAKKKS